MTKNKFFQLSLAIIVTFLLQSCDPDKSSFGEDLEVGIIPTDLSYPEIINAREFSYIQTSTPFINSNGHSVFFEIVSIKMDGAILDETYMNSVTILNPETIEITHEVTGDLIVLDDLSNAGKIIIEEGNPFSSGEYYFTIKTSVTINGVQESKIFEDVFHLNVGPDLVDIISFCPFKYNFIPGSTTNFSVAPEVVSGNPNILFELGTESDKLSIDPVTGVISLNPNYSITATEFLNPVINVISTISNEVVSFENTITVALSADPVDLGLTIDYFFYPSFKSNNPKNLAAGGDGWSRKIPVDAFASWVSANHIGREDNPVSTPDAVAARAAAGITGNKALRTNYWGPLVSPWETWIIADPVNLASYKGCFDTKVVFWTKINLPAEAPLDYFPDGRTPVGMEIQITDNYTGDLTTTNWTQINDILTCEIEDNGTEFIGTPYPLSGVPNVDDAKNANGKWVRCELDMANYIENTSFTIAFRNLTYYDVDLSSTLRGEAFISDLHFVATEKQ